MRQADERPAQNPVASVFCDEQMVRARRDAINTTLNGFQPGALVRGLRPRVKLCFWVSYEDTKGQMSLPSALHAETLVDLFREK